MTAPLEVCSISVVLQDTGYLLPHPGCKGEKKQRCVHLQEPSVPGRGVSGPSSTAGGGHWLQLASSCKGLTSHLLQREGSWKAKFALLRICNFKNLLYSSFANPMSMCRLLEVAFAARTVRTASLICHANKSKNALWLPQSHPNYIKFPASRHPIHSAANLMEPKWLFSLWFL